MRQPSSADLAEQPLTPDTPVTTASRDCLERSTLLSIDASLQWAALCWAATFFRLDTCWRPQYISADTVRAGDVQRGPVRCLVREWRGRQRRAGRRRVAFVEQPGRRRARQRLNRIAAACADLLNQSDVAVIQHEYGIYGGVDGDEVVGIIERLRVPSIVVAHTILKDPTPHQRSVFETIMAMADQVVVMSDGARQRLCEVYNFDRRKVTTIAHGATVPPPPVRSVPVDPPC